MIKDKFKIQKTNITERTNMKKFSDLLNNVIKKEEKRRDKPQQNKQYLLVGGEGTKSIANGNTWAESEIKNNNQGGA